MNIAIVTGASSGIGREFVRRIAGGAEGSGIDEIWVIARRAEKLKELQKASKIKIVPIPMDLSDEKSIDKYKSQLEKAKPRVQVLVNAAGYGKFGTFTSIPPEEQTGMIDLNVRALTQITYITLKYMKKGSRIYQMGSLSAFQPVPYMGVYAATKAYVLSFSRALGKELELRGIRVMAVCPGWVRTEFFDRAENGNNVITYFNKMFTVREVVDRAIKDMHKGCDVSVCGASVRLQVLAVRLLPHKLVMNIWCAQQGK